MARTTFPASHPSRLDPLAALRGAQRPREWMTIPWSNVARWKGRTIDGLAGPVLHA